MMRMQRGVAKKICEVMKYWDETQLEVYGKSGKDLLGERKITTITTSPWVDSSEDAVFFKLLPNSQLF
jgi:hypothetical protein